jgi:hypothetical protein
MDSCFYKDALIAGMTPNAFKLGTVLHQGWFWPRPAGCSLLYRGDSIETIDYDQIVEVCDFNASEIQPPDYLLHQSNTTCFYCFRRANGCGDTERTLSASVRVAIDSEGNLAEPVPNSVFTIKAEIVQGSRAKLTWFYCTMQQQSPPVRFNIYTDTGQGQIDYQNPIAQIEYQGRRFYGFTTEQLPEGEHLFAVRTQNEDDLEDNSSAAVSVEIYDDNNCLVQFSGFEHV